ncbi:MAG: Slp family lipoprotein [Gammaproteobacteria bacterium]
MWAKTGLFCVLLVAGCASVPPQIKAPPLGDPSISLVQKDAESHRGELVRWGGSIVEVENKENHTLVIVVAKALGRSGRPQGSDHSPGRFIARVEGFLDPDVYKTDREATVYGVIEGQLMRKIGEKSYEYPLVKAETVYLWPDYSQYTYRYSPYYYPYYSLRPYPFYYGFRFGRSYYW